MLESVEPRHSPASRLSPAGAPSEQDICGAKPPMITPSFRRVHSLFSVICSLLLASMAVSSAQSTSYLVIDTRSGKILDGKNYTEKLPVASLTKIVTACVALDWLEGTQGDRNRFITVPNSMLSMNSANPLKFQPGDQITIRDALFCALMASDNIAAETLAENLGNEMLVKSGRAANTSSSLDLFGKSDKMTGRQFFVDQMNALAQAQGMTRSSFVNPHGLDEDKPRGFSTAEDMAKIAVHALEKPSFNFIVSQTQRDVSYLRQGQEQRYRIHNTNKLLGQYGVDGVKTGRTARAGDCLITSVRKDDKITMLEGNRRIRTPYHLVVVTLNSSDRFGQTIQLADQGWRAYDAWLAAGAPAKRNDRIEILRRPTQ